MAHRNTKSSSFKLIILALTATIAFSVLFAFLVRPYQIDVKAEKRPVVLLGNFLNSHILRVHVDKSPEWLEKRLKYRDYIRFVSTFYTIENAEDAIQSVIEDKRSRINAWVRDQTVTKNMRTHFHKHFDISIGYGIKRGKSEDVIKLHDIKVIIQKVNNYSYKIISAYPVPKRNTPSIQQP